MSRKTFIALGSNQPSIAGDPVETVQAAMRQIAEVFETESTMSRLYLSPAFPAGSGPDFCNAMVGLETPDEPRAVLVRLHDIERDFNRARKVRWAPRTLDLDLIAQDDLVLPDQQTFDHWRDLSLEAQQERAPDGLILPHPRLQDRAFVLKPFADIAPDWHHPVLGKTVAEMLCALPEGEKAPVLPAD